MPTSMLTYRVRSRPHASIHHAKSYVHIKIPTSTCTIEKWPIHLSALEVLGPYPLLYPSRTERSAALPCLPSNLQRFVLGLRVYEKLSHHIDVDDDYSHVIIDGPLPHDRYFLCYDGDIRKRAMGGPSNKRLRYRRMRK